MLHVTGLDLPSVFSLSEQRGEPPGSAPPALCALAIGISEQRAHLPEVEQELR